MSTITAILEPDVDGTLHVPIPADLLGGKVRIIATLQAVAAVAPVGAEDVVRRETALTELRQLGGLRDVISDPVQWQREARQDRTMPGPD